MDTIGHCWVSAGYGSCKVLNLTFLDGQTNQIMEVSRESIKYAHVPAPNGKTVKHLRQKKHELESFGSCWDSYYLIVSFAILVICQMVAACSRAAGSISNVVAYIAGVYRLYVQSFHVYQKAPSQLSLRNCFAMVEWKPAGSPWQKPVSQFQSRSPSYKPRLKKMEIFQPHLNTRGYIH